MTQPTQPISPLRQRMIEDMHMRKLAPKTRASYIHATFHRFSELIVSENRWKVA